MIKYILTVSLQFFFFTYTVAQTVKADSLIRSLSSMNRDTQYVQFLNLIAEELSDKEADKSLEFALKGLALSQQLKFIKGEGNSLNNISWAYYRKGDYSKGFDYALQALHLNVYITNLQ